MNTWLLGHRTVSVCLGLVMLLGCTEGWAQWTDDLYANTRLTDSPNPESSPSSVSDGMGGTITCFTTGNPGDIYNKDIGVQRLDSAGMPLWGPSGILINTDSYQEPEHQLISDGAGGAFLVYVVFEDSSEGIVSSAFAQHLGANGDFLWGVSGVDLCEFPSNQSSARSVSDGSGGIVVGWIDVASGGQTGVYSQRVDSSGILLWSPSGNPVGSNSDNIYNLSIASASGLGQVAMFSWSEYSDVSSQYTIMGQILDETGAGLISVIEMSIYEGLDFETLYLYGIAPDMTGGYFVVWASGYPGFTFAQHILADGTQTYNSGGVRIDGENDYQSLPQIVADGVGGAYVMCEDYNLDGDGSRLMIQRLDSIGPRWGEHGLDITELSEGYIQRHQLSSDGAGGAYVSWGTDVGGANFAQHISASGTMLWPDDRGPFTNNIVYQLSNLIPDGNGNTVALWSGRFSGSTPVYAFAQRLDQNGYPIDSEFSVLSAADRPNDQGGEVVLTWEKSPLDSVDHQTVVNYSYWVRPVAKAGVEAAERPGIPVLPDAEVATLLNIEIPQVVELRDSGWTYGGLVPAVLSDDYSVFCPTYGDSTDVGITYSEFKVLAHHSIPAVFWETENILPGYSVDNLSPGAPLNLAGLNNAGAVDLSWNASGVNDDDLREYRIYRGDASGFPLDEDHLLGATADLELQDLTASGNVWYRATAVDAHGNEGSASNEIAVSLGVSAVGAVPVAFRHNGNYPNPFNPATHISFDLPSEAPVVLTIFSVDGRQIATLVNRTMSAGSHRVLWNGQDSSGRAVASGVYYSRLQTDRDTAVGKMTLVR